MTDMPQVPELIRNMATQIQSTLTHQARDEFLIVGIQTGGAWLADELKQHLHPDQPVGYLNIAFYRDDFTRIGLHPKVQPSQLPFNIDGRHVILVDDVLYTGRTIRAAMNELFDYGRPASILLAVLVDRNDRELPIGADIVGLNMELKSGQQIKLKGPDPLKLELIEA
ncbi:MAG: bifunctional pyr operon transcriptional regulator/uracil phosphoribosyltransferase PyrR [Gammaproteobacteria bacterium]|nr:MAG: bifunctional pyr operon transcriptional regulator/uracil phosphoribosyltransferase PyrR [Gammaproteobacteria bacterium]